MSMLIKNAQNSPPVYVEGNKIVSIGKGAKSDEVIDAKGKALLPGLVNTHTHAAMTLFRGYADDLTLDQWPKRVWPVEAKLTAEQIASQERSALLDAMGQAFGSF